MKCSCCETEWPKFSEQAVAVELRGHCMACESKYGFHDSLAWTDGMWEEIPRVANSRWSSHIAGSFHEFLGTVAGTP